MNNVWIADVIDDVPSADSEIEVLLFFLIFIKLLVFFSVYLGITYVIFLEMKKRATKNLKDFKTKYLLLVTSLLSLYLFFQLDPFYGINSISVKIIRIMIIIVFAALLNFVVFIFFNRKGKHKKN